MTKNKIGYGNPPETTKFKKGICPNPKGRPRKTNLMLGDLVDRALQSKMHFTERGLPLSASRLRVAIKSHIARALSGDIGSALALLKMREQARFPLNEENKAQRARAVDQRARALAEWLDAQAARDSNGDDAAWLLKPCQSLMFVNGAGELDQKHDQDLRDTCVMLLDRAGCDLLTICDITGHSYRSAQTIVKHYRARNADRADAGIDRLELQVRKEGMTG
jgi:hypothetical protein